MSTPANPSPAETIERLESARKLALNDPTHYTRLIPSLLPAFAPSAALELRRWGTALIAEGLSSPYLASEQKQQLSLAVLKTLKEYLEVASEDTTVIKNIIQAATSVYPLVFRHTIYTPNDASPWQDMSAIKSSILKREISAPAGIRVCCVKFIQRIVQVQTPGLVTDPRRPDQNDISLALLSNEHPILSPSHLQAEASGLLDRMLSVFHDSDPSEGLLLSATLNSCSTLVRSRAQCQNRILMALLNFNSLKGASPSTPTRVRLTMRSMERNVRVFLLNFNKRHPGHPMGGRISGYLDHMHELRTTVFEERSRKRSPPVEPNDGLDNAKRQRLGADIPEASPQQLAVSSLPPGGACTLAQLFSLTNNDTLRTFDAHFLPLPLLQQITAPLLKAANPAHFSNAVDAVRARWDHLRIPQAPPVQSADRIALDVAADDDDDYDPSEGLLGAEQIANVLDKTTLPVAPPPPPTAVDLGPFVVPQPPPLSGQDSLEYGRSAVMRVFGAVGELQEPNSKAPKSGFNRVAASSYDRDSWITVISRLATRALSGLETESDTVKKEGQDTALTRNGLSISNTLRETMFRYILDDWRKRIDVAVSWLNEEWYNDQVSKEAGGAGTTNYETWALKVFDGILPYLDAKDKLLIRFLSEVPAINLDILERVKRLARDPERVSLAVNAIHYLALFRPPVRDICIDALEDLYTNYDDARASTTKLLQRWRPEFLQKTEPPLTKDVKSPTPAQTAASVGA